MITLALSLELDIGKQAFTSSPWGPARSTPAIALAGA
jgi:hypothetical protein